MRQHLLEEMFYKTGWLNYLVNATYLYPDSAGAWGTKDQRLLNCSRFLIFNLN